jgi:hypothetical protein
MSLKTKIETKETKEAKETREANVTREAKEAKDKKVEIQLVSRNDYTWVFSIEDALKYYKKNKGLWKMSFEWNKKDYRIVFKTKTSQWTKSSEIKLCNLSREYKECKDVKRKFFINQSIINSDYLYKFCTEFGRYGIQDWLVKDNLKKVFLKEGVKNYYVDPQVVLEEFLKLESANISAELRKVIDDFLTNKTKTISQQDVDEILSVDMIKDVFNNEQDLIKLFSSS